MAADLYTWVKNLNGAREPFRYLGKFQAGSTQEIKRGEFLELSSGNFVPLATDKAMAGTVAVAAKTIKADHKAGYYPIFVSRPGDVWEYELSAAAAAAQGAALYNGTDSQKVTTTAGTNIMGHVLDHAGIPAENGNPETGDIADRGTTIKSVSRVHMTIKEGASYWVALQGDDA